VPSRCGRSRSPTGWRGSAHCALARREEIVDRITQDTGKSRSDALISEVYGVLDNLVYLEKHAGKALADRRVPTPIALMGKSSRLWFEPLGTVLVIAPWNYPFYQALVPITCAFVAGNAVVGNRLNLITRWQALEYVTAQNLERRALARELASLDD